MRVIIVGSGLSGLVMGHCLLQAGIDDFVILERRPDPKERSGSVISLGSPTSRILDQIGVLQDLQKLCPTVHRWLHLDPEGQTIYDGGWFDYLRANHGHRTMFLMRRDLMEVLYSRLPDRERYVLPNKTVTGVGQDSSSVTVTCSDGSVYQGDVLVGCDGVHSVVHRLAFTGPTKSAPKSEYRGLFGSSPRSEGIAPCGMTETHDKDIGFIIMCTDTTAFWLVTQRKHADALDKQQYTAKDIQAFVDQYADHSVAPGKKLTFGDLWRTRNTDPDAGMYDFREGIAERWYNGRVVLVGDAAHRMTPNLGQGGNASIESVASLTNQLHALIKEKGGANPTTAELEAAFARYYHEREGPVKRLAGLSNAYTRWTCWRNWFGWFMMYWVWPTLGDGFIVNRLLSPTIRESIKLDFVKEKNLPAGRVPWKHQ